MAFETKECIVHEMLRLRVSPCSDDKPGGIGTVDFAITCQGNATEVMEKAKAVLLTVDENSIDNWPDDNEWKAILPDWFIDKCAPEMTREQADKRQSKWRRIFSRRRADTQAEEAWSLLNWLYWFEHDNREWFWWDGKVADENTIVCKAEVYGWPFPWGSLKWLFLACGAEHVYEDS